MGIEISCYVQGLQWESQFSEKPRLPDEQDSRWQGNVFVELQRFISLLFNQ